MGRRKHYDSIYESRTAAGEAGQGKLKIQVYAALRSLPVADAEISISYTGDPGNILEEVKTNASGESPEVELPTPPLEYSVEPSEYQPYSEYTLRITKRGTLR